MLRRSDLASRQGVGVNGQREFGLMGSKEITQIFEKRHNHLR
jgi:hypothetical protein